MESIKPEWKGVRKLRTPGGAQQLSLALTPIENEPRIRDLDLAERLGFSQLPDIRKIIKRNEKKLKEINEIATVARCIETGNGSRRTVQEYYLNQKQAIFICMKSETDKAIDVQMEIVHTFDAYLKGDLVLSTPRTPSIAELRPHLLANPHEDRGAKRENTQK